MGVRLNVDISKAVKGMDESIRKAIDASLENPRSLNTVAEILKEDIKLRTRIGKGTEDGKALEKFAALKPKSVKARRRLAKNNVVDEAYAPATSNLTFTGQLIKSMTHKVAGKIITLFFPKTIHKPYIYVQQDGTISKPPETPLTNEQLAEYVQQKRPFFFLYFKDPKKDPLYRRIAEVIKRDFRRNLKTFFKGSLK